MPQVPEAGPPRAAPSGDGLEFLLEVAEEGGVLEGSGHERDETGGEAGRPREWIRGTGT